MIPISSASAEAGVQTMQRTIAEIDQRTKENPHECCAQERRLADAVAFLVEAIHQASPTVSIRSIPPYEDEDFTLEARIPTGMDRDMVMKPVFSMR